MRPFDSASLYYLRPETLNGEGAGLRGLNLSGGYVDTSTPMGSMLFTIMVALARMDHDIKRDRIVDSIGKRREGPRRKGRLIGDSKIRSTLRLVESGEPAS
ncbi:recombinase family protein [Arthrobacter sp. TMT4-20]